MAQSERLRGSRSPVVNYKVGDGSVKDLFRYIMGEDLVVKKIKPKRKQTKVIKKDKELVRQLITSGIQGSVEATAPNPFGADIIRGSAEATAPDPFGADQFKVNREDNMMGPVVEPPGEVLMENTPPTIRASEGPMKVRPQPGYDRLAMQGENVVGRSGQPRRQSPVESYQRGVSRPETMTPEEVELERKMRENPDFFYGGDPETKIYGRDRSDIIMTPPGGGMAYGGKVSTPKKKRKKRLSKGGKVTSYNY